MHLFSPLSLRGVTIPNRVSVSPMSQYVAKDGFANDWHLVHLGRFALGGAGLVLTEATAVEERGRRTHGDLGLWADAQIDPLARVAAFLETNGSVPGVQLGHAGRKASERRPWDGETPVNEEDEAERSESPWPTIGPSAEPYGPGWHVPAEMTTADIGDVVDAFRAAARRAKEANFKVIEVYAAHGFLLHQFYSPIANRRADDYGGCFDNRIRICLEVADAIREVWPEDRVLQFRLSATDWIESGWTVDETVELARRLGARGVDMIVCSSGAIGGPTKPQRMPLAQGFQACFAQRVREEAGIPSTTVGFIWDPHHAEQIVAGGEADMVALARELLANPNWSLHAAHALGDDGDFRLWKPQFGWWLERRERVVRKLNLR